MRRVHIFYTYFCFLSASGKNLEKCQKGQKSGIAEKGARRSKMGENALKKR